LNKRFTSVTDNFQFKSTVKAIILNSAPFLNENNRLRTPDIRKQL